MECPQCHFENPEGIRFCGDCGARLQEVCPECGNPNPLHFRFCGKCGQKLTVEAAVAATEPVADAERKQVTALFSDLSGYTAMTTRLDPEDVKDITSRIFDGVRTVVDKYDGFIEKFAGDGVLALFGVPKSHEDDPIRAIRAGREIHELVDAMSPEYEATIGAPLSMHSGINTGLTVAADVDVEKGTHRVTGDAINMAARLSDLAKAGEIFVGPETHRRAEGHFTFETLEPAVVKGKVEPISMYKVISVKDQPITVHRQSGLRAKLIGRKAELAQLHEAVERLKQGQGSIIALCGDAGTGKSRLVDEFKSTLDPSKIRWREGHSYPYSQNIPYFPLMDLMNRAWKIEEGDPPATVRQKIESGIERLLGTREDIAPYVGSLYALSYPEIEGVSPEFWRSSLFSGIQAIVSALTRYAPTIFCFEDIHWADPSMLELIRLLVSDPSCPALYLCVYRLPFTLFSAHQLSSLGYSYEEIRLQDLSQSDTLDMVVSLLQTDRVPADLRKFIQKKVEGNPFYVEEAINSLVETGALARDNGAWKLTRLLNEADIPPTVQGVISARLDRLEKEMKRILQEASVIGRAFLHDILKRVTALQDSLDRSLRGLEMLDLVRVRSVQPDLEYIFKHALTQEVVYNGLLKKDRREMHERIGLVMERLFRDRLPEFYETLAFHFKQGRSRLKSVDYLIRSGEKGFKRYALDEAHQSYREAFDLIVNNANKTKEEERLLIDVLLGWAFVYYYSGNVKELEPLLKAHVDIAESLSDKVRLGDFYARLGVPLWFAQKLREAYQCLRKSLELGEETGSDQVLGYACTWLTYVCYELGRLDEGLAFGKKAHDIARSVGSDHWLYIKSLNALGAVYYVRGDRNKTLHAGKELLDYSRKHGQTRGMVMGHLAIGWSHLISGDLRAAIECFERAAQVSADPLYLQLSRCFLGLTHVSNGLLDKAKDVLPGVLEFSERFGTEFIGTPAQMGLGTILIAEGNVEEGIKTLQNVQRVLRRCERKPFLVLCECILGQVYSQISQAEEPVGFAATKAEEHFNQAIEIAREIGSKSRLAQAYLDLGRLHKATNKKEKATECISKAIEYFELCEADTFLKQARQVLESLG